MKTSNTYFRFLVRRLSCCVRSHRKAAASIVLLFARNTLFQDSYWVYAEDGIFPMGRTSDYSNGRPMGAATVSYVFRDAKEDPVTLLNTGERFSGVVSNTLGKDTSAVATLTEISCSTEGTDIPFHHTIVDASGVPSPHCKALGDLDGDGFPDICAASSTDSPAGLVWYRYPDWKKHTVSQGIYTTEMRLADIDGDGDLDIVIPKGTGDAVTICWYENPRPTLSATTGPWTMHVIGDEVGHDVSVGDIDKDGRLDVVVRNGLRTVVFFQGTGGVWTRKNISARAMEGLSLGDIDGDGDLDVVINGYWLQNPLPLTSPITGTWRERTIDATWPTYSKAYVVDLNKDGRLDVILTVTESPNARFSWFESTSPVTGPWVEHVIDNTLSYLHSLAVADLDLDGSLDVVTAEMHQSSNPHLVCVYRNGGNALTWTRQIIDTTGSHNVVVGDIGSDGDIDVVGSNWSSEATNGAPIEFWENLLRAPSTAVEGEKTVSERVPLSDAFTLFRNFPNPFNPITMVSYQLPVASNVRLVVFDLLGREVAVLVNEREDAGVHEVRFDGYGCSSGVYFYRIQAGDFVSTKRMLVLR